MIQQLCDVLDLLWWVLITACCDMVRRHVGGEAARDAHLQG